MDAQQVTALVTSLMAANNEQLIASLANRFQHLSTSSSSSPPPGPSPTQGAEQRAVTTPDAGRNQSETHHDMDTEEDGDDEWDDEPAEYSDGGTAWRGVLPRNKRQVTGRGGDVVARLKHPPPLDEVSAAMKDATPIDGLPEAPPPRRSGGDRALFLTQKNWNSS